MAFINMVSKVLLELDFTREDLSKASKIEVEKIHELYYRKNTTLDLIATEKVLDILNERAKIKGINKTYTLNDILKYENNAG